MNLIHERFVGRHLVMANQPSLWRVIRIQIRPRKPKRTIPRVSRRTIPRPQIRNRRLRSSRRILSSLVRTTDIGQLVVNSVRNDIWVQSLLLAFVDERVLRLEGEGCAGAAVEPGLEFHGGDAEAEVETCDCGGDESGECPCYGIGDGAEADTGGRAEEGAARAGAGSCGAG